MKLEPTMKGIMLMLTPEGGGNATSRDVPVVVRMNGCISGERKNGIVMVG